MHPSDAAKAISHPLRADLLVRLREKRSPNELAQMTGAPIGNVAYHSKTMRQRGTAASPVRVWSPPSRTFDSH